MKMSDYYITTITKSGQITLSKNAREVLGVHPGERIQVKINKDGISIDRKLSDEEFIAKIDEINAQSSPETKQKIKEYAGKTVNELMDIYANSPEGRAEFEEEYGH